MKRSRRGSWLVAVALVASGLSIIDTLVPSAARAADGSTNPAEAPTACQGSDGKSGIGRRDWKPGDSKPPAYVKIWAPQNASVQLVTTARHPDAPDGNGDAIYYHGIANLDGTTISEDGFAPIPYWHTDPSTGVFKDSGSGTFNWTNSGASRYVLAFNRLDLTVDVEQAYWSTEITQSVAVNLPQCTPGSDETDVPNEAEGNACGAQPWDGDPVNVVQGNFWQSWADVTVPGRGPGLALGRTYSSSRASTDGPFGYGWSSSYGMSVTEASGVARVRQGTGAMVPFYLEGGQWLGAPRVNATLAKAADGAWTFTRAGTEVFRFSAAGALTSIADLSGNQTSLTYANGVLATVADSSPSPATRSLSFSWLNGRVSSVSVAPATSLASGEAPTTITVGYGYDGAGNLSTVTDPAGGIWTYTYDSGHRLVTVREPRHHSLGAGAPVVENHYDAQGRIDWQEDRLDRRTTFNWGTAGQTTVTDPKGNVTVYEHQNGICTAIVRDPGANQSRWAFKVDPSTLGRYEVVDPNGKVTRATFNHRGLPTTVTDGFGTTSITYNAQMLPTAVTDASGVTTTLSYDSGTDRLRSMSRPIVFAGSTEGTWQVDLTYGDTANPGRVTSVEDERNQIWALAYNASGDVVESTTPGGKRTTWAYNGLGWPLSSVAPEGNVTGGTPADHRTSYRYNAAGQVLSVTDPLGAVSSYQRDLSGNVTTITDPVPSGAAAEVTTLTRNAAGELTSVLRPDQTSVGSEYWPDGSLKRQLDAASAATSYAYDGQGRLSTITDPASRVTTFRYDAGGRLVSRQAHGGDCLATVRVDCISYSYLASGALGTIDYSSPGTSDVSYAYDALGRRTTMTDGTGDGGASGRFAWAWDSLSRLRSFTHDRNLNVSGVNDTVSYGYADATYGDAGREATSLTYPGGKTVARTYDTSGRLSSVSAWAAVVNGSASFAYDSNSNLTTIDSAATTGVEDSFGYDRANRLNAFTLRQGANQLASLGYTRNPEGAVLSSSGSGVAGAADTYAYSLIDMLSSDAAGTYTFDAADNLTGFPDGRRQRFNAAHELCYQSPTSNTAGCSTPPGDATTFAFDGHGNRIKQQSGGGTTRFFSYDQADRLAAVSHNRVEAGMIVATTAASTPAGWVEANGSTLSRTSSAELFAALGTTYGAGDGTSTFHLPDLRGRSVVGVDAGSTSFDVLGESGGQADVTLAIQHLPSHSHTQAAHDHPQLAHTHTQPAHGHSGTLVTSGSHSHLAGWDGSASGGGNASLVQSFGQKIADGWNFMGNAGSHSHDVTTTSNAATSPAVAAQNRATTAVNDPTGGGQPHSNLKPYVTVRWLVASGDGAALSAGMALPYAGTTVPNGWSEPAAFNGRTPIGLSPTDTRFDVLAETGGAKTVTLTEAQMPSHNHTQDPHTPTQVAHSHAQQAHGHGGAVTSSTDPGHTHPMGWAGAASGSGNAFVVDQFGGNAFDGWGFLNTTGDHSQCVRRHHDRPELIRDRGQQPSPAAANQNAGGVSSHTNLQPYLTVRWIEATTPSPAVEPGMLFPRADTTAAAPQGYLDPNGATVSRSDYGPLFNALGTTYGAGDGSTTFRVPDLRGRLPVDTEGTTANEFYPVGTAGGAADVTLTSAQMPLHTHTQQAHTHEQEPHRHDIVSDHTGTSTTAGSHTHPVGWSGSASGSGNAFTTHSFNKTADGAYFVGYAGDHPHTFTLPSVTATNDPATADNNPITATNQNTGGGQAHTNLQPYMALRWALAVTAPSVTYTYDGEGLRATKTTVDGTVTRFTWDRSSGLPLLLAEIVDAPGTTNDKTVRYLYGPTGHILADISTPGNNTSTSTPTLRWYHQDQLGSTRALTDSTGTAIGTYAYTPYGKPNGSTGTATTPIGWAGEYRDAETGFIYLRARYYDPDTAQFLTRDPLEPVTRSAYGYAANNPLNFTDPTGLAPWDGVVDFFTGGDCGDGFFDRALGGLDEFVWTYRDEIIFGLALVGTASCPMCTAAFYASMGLGAVSTVHACNSGDGASCALGVAALATGGAGRALSRGAAPRLGAAADVRLGASRWHPIQRNVTGPILRAGETAARRSGFWSGWTSNALSGVDVVNG